MRTWMIICLVALAGPGCKTFVDLAPTEKGGVLNPVRCDMPAGQRAYLKLLRGPGGEKVEYEYLDAVMGPGKNILDRFLIANPAYRSAARGPLRTLLDLIRPDPDLPRFFRIYMDMYHPGVLDAEAIPGYSRYSDGPTIIAPRRP